MKYVLHLGNQEIFLEALLKNTNTDETDLNEMLEGCKYFYHTIYGNSYFLSKSNETRLRKTKIEESEVSGIYDLTARYDFSLEELSAEFIEFMLRGHSLAEQSLDDNIVLLHNAFVSRYE